MVTSLQPNEVFVFGSNLEGQHTGGAAKQAYQDFGAVWGIGAGLRGQTYAIPTMPPLNILDIEGYIDQFLDYARLTPDKTYLVTAIGTGIAGYTHEQMEEIWNKYNLPSNVKRI